MGWDAYLTDDHGRSEGCWGFTHNTSRMVYAALDSDDWTIPGAERWYEVLNGKSGPDGAAYLHRIITGLEADPDRFRAMNPANGWGDYDTLLKVLTDMRNAVPEWPTVWGAGG